MVAKKTARKRGSRKPSATRAARKRSATRTARKKAVARAGGKKSAARRAPKKSAARATLKQSATRPIAKKSAKRRPALTIVPRAKAARTAPRPKPARRARVAQTRAPTAQPFAAAKAAATAKELAIFELVRARVAVSAAVQGMTAGSAEQPAAPGKWSTREMVLHLAYWDHEMLLAVEEAFQHNRRPHLTHDEINAINPGAVATLAHHDWEAAKRLMEGHRDRLLEALDSLPDEPAETWSREHAVGWIVAMLTEHDRAHAATMRAARIARETRTPVR